MLKSIRALALAALIGLCPFYASEALAQAVQLPPGKQCFQAVTGINGMVGVLGTITGGSGGTSGTYANIALTGGSGTGATANITVSGGAVSQVVIVDPGINYAVGDALSASSGNIGNVTGFSVPVNSISINSSLAGGSVGMYIPSTLTAKQTWQDAAETILNTNPIELDANGCATIFGSGTYRQILYDNLGNEVWDQLTYAPPQNPYWAGLAGGTANAITVTDGNFSGTDGQSIQFIAANTNTGATTLNPSGFGAISIEKNTLTGPVPLTGSEIGTGNLVSVTYSATNNYFLLSSAYNITAGWGLALSNSQLAISSSAPPYSFDAPINMGLTASVSSSALTINLTTASGATPSASNPVLVPFRSTTQATGTPTWAAITSGLSITVPSGATLGTSNNTPFRIWVFLAYDSGTPELAVATCSNASQIFPCSGWETSGVATTTIGAGSGSAGTPYATTGASGDSVRIIGYAEYGSGLGTAGTWSAVPSTLQLMGPGTKKPGDIVQTVQNQTITQGTTTSSTFAALSSGQSQAITPSDPTNLIRLQLTGTAESPGSASTIGIQLARGSTLIGVPQYRTINVSGWTGPISLETYDFPGVNSSTTYNVYGKTSTGTLTYPGASTTVGSTLEIQEIMG